MLISLYHTLMVRFVLFAFLIVSRLLLNSVFIDHPTTTGFCACIRGGRSEGTYHRRRHNAASGRQTYAFTCHPTFTTTTTSLFRRHPQTSPEPERRGLNRRRQGAGEVSLVAAARATRRTNVLLLAIIRVASPVRCRAGRTTTCTRTGFLASRHCTDRTGCVIPAQLSVCTRPSESVWFRRGPAEDNKEGANQRSKKTTSSALF
jgi:hypothetical protein